MRIDWASMGTVLGLSFALATVGTSLTRAVARRFGLLDRPNVRSSHQSVVPRGGGAAILAATLLGLAASGALGRSSEGATLVLGAIALGLVGLWDDRFGLPPLRRLAFQLAVAVAAVAGGATLQHLPLPPPLDLPLGFLGPVLAVIWIVAVINFFNFIDGIDGLAALQGVVTGLGLALLAWDPLAAAAGAALAGGCLGFLLFNWSPASIFMGDIGSYFLGYTLAALPLLAPVESRPHAVLFMGLSLWLFLADATWTLARRVARGERWYEAHREHLYQRLTTRFGPRRVAAGIGLGSCLLTTMALAAWRSPHRHWGWAGLATAMVLFGGEWAMTRRGESR